MNEYFLAAALALGLAIGGSVAWMTQAARIDHIKSEHAAFVANTKAEGEAAARRAAELEATYRTQKEESDRDYQSRIASLDADVRRLRDKRTGRSYVPAAAPGADNPNRACFGRADLESAIGKFIADIQGLVEQGDVALTGLNVAKEWADARNH